MTTPTARAREITATMRGLFPRPVRLACRATETDDLFALTVPSAVAAQLGRGTGYGGLTRYLSRHLAVPVRVSSDRPITRRDCGTDVEIILGVNA